MRFGSSLVLLGLVKECLLLLGLLVLLALALQLDRRVPALVVPHELDLPAKVPSEFRVERVHDAYRLLLLRVVRVRLQQVFVDRDQVLFVVCRNDLDFVGQQRVLLAFGLRFEFEGQAEGLRLFLHLGVFPGTTIEKIRILRMYEGKYCFFV